MPGLKYGRAFMIGWKAKYGYVPSGTTLKSLSDIVFTDDGPFTIPTIFNGFEKYDNNTANISSASTGIKYNKIEELAPKLEAMFGSDYYYLYGRPYLMLKQNNYDVLSRAIPSAILSCPVLCSHQLTNEDNTLVYIPALKKIIYAYYIFNVNDDGTLTNLPHNNYVRYQPPGQSFQFERNGDNYSRFFCLFAPAYDGTKESIINGPYYMLQVAATSVAKSVIAVNYSENNDFAKQYFTQLFSDFSKPDLPINPFDPIDPSGPDTPGGKFDDQSDIIGDSTLPSLSASDTGFTRIYIPTLSQVQDLARYLWTDDTVIETIWNKIKQFFENPMEAIIGFNLVPVQVPSSGTKSFALMYIDTGVDMDTAANQFVDVDCGTLPIQLYYGSALDYSPYTKISCYLPYIGMVQLNTDEVVGRTLQVKYRIDIVSGSCVAKIFVDGNCIYQYSGHCAITIPIAASDFSSYVSAAISVAKLAVGAATGGAGGAAAAALNADVNQQTGSMFSMQGGVDNSGQIQLFAQGGASGPGTQAEPEIKNTQASFSGITPQNVANTVGEIMTAKPHVQHSGSFSGNSGYLGVRRPFVIIERPNLCLPENYQGLNGFPAMITMLLGECSGYTKVQQMVLSGCTATNPEQAEIMSLLKGGVIF